MYRWRLFKHYENFVEVWDRIGSEWEKNHSAPPGELLLQFVVESESLESMRRFRGKALLLNKVDLSKLICKTDKSVLSV